MEPSTPRVLLIGGRSGVGKTSVGYEVSDQLRQADVPHVLIDGDNLDHVYPKPEGSSMTEANLASLWHNYEALGQHRLISVNTVSVLENEMVVRAVGGTAVVTSILLTVEDATARSRIRQREIGSGLDEHLTSNHDVARRLESKADSSVHRVPTDDRSLADVASVVIHLWHASQD